MGFCEKRFLLGYQQQKFSPGSGVGTLVFDDIRFMQMLRGFPEEVWRHTSMWLSNAAID